MTLPQTPLHGAKNTSRVREWVMNTCCERPLPSSKPKGQELRGPTIAPSSVSVSVSASATAAPVPSQSPTRREKRTGGALETKAKTNTAYRPLPLPLKAPSTLGQHQHHNLKTRDTFKSRTTTINNSITYEDDNHAEDDMTATDCWNRLKDENRNKINDFVAPLSPPLEETLVLILTVAYCLTIMAMVCMISSVVVAARIVHSLGIGESMKAILLSIVTILTCHLGFLGKGGIFQ